MKLPKGPITAQDLERLKDEMLRNDPEYRAKVEAAEAGRQYRIQMLREAERPILADLRAVGVAIDTVWDLVNTSNPYPSALPVLMDHLERGGYPDRVMESLGRALAVAPSIAFWERLKKCWLVAKGPGEEEGAAVALAACASKAQLDDLIEFLAVEEQGQSRVHFIEPVLVLGGEQGLEVVERLRTHPLLKMEAVVQLRRKQR